MEFIAGDVRKSIQITVIAPESLPTRVSVLTAMNYLAIP
jgi:hypothetical protein